MNMGLLMAAYLCVLVWAQAPSVKVNLATAVEPRIAVVPNSPIVYSLSSIVGLPTNKWAISSWVYITYGGLEGLLLAVVDGVTNVVNMQWPSNSVPVFSNGVWESKNFGQYLREDLKWFHFSMGSDGQTGFGVVTLRGSITQIDTAWQATMTLTSTTSIKAPFVEGASFVVIST